MEVPTLHEFKELAAQVKYLQEQLGEAMCKIGELGKMPTRWYRLKDARPYFAVDRHTFKRWVLNWIEDGTLIKEQNYKTIGDEILLSHEFLTGRKEVKGLSHLRKTG